MPPQQDSNEEESSADGKAQDKFEELQHEVELRSQVKKMRTGPRKTRVKKENADAADKKKGGKKMTKWDDTKLSKKEIMELDRSKMVSPVANELNANERVQSDDCWTHCVDHG